MPPKCVILSSESSLFPRPLTRLILYQMYHHHATGGNMGCSVTACPLLGPAWPGGGSEQQEPNRAGWPVPSPAPALVPHTQAWQPSPGPSRGALCMGWPAWGLLNLSSSLPPGELQQLLGPEYPHVVFSRLASEGAPDCPQGPGLVRQFGRCFALAARHELQDHAVFYVGAEGLTLTNFMLSWNRCPFSSFNPATGCGRHESLNANRALLRRLYLVERARDARVVGILVGTLGVAGYLSILDHLRGTLRRAGKRSYTLAMGKLSPAKLANFLEVDVFVLVACPQNSLLDSRDFYRPVVTPYELELACNPARDWSSLYVTDFRDLLPGGCAHVGFPDTVPGDGDVPDVSLITGELRATGLSSSPAPSSSSALACRTPEFALAEISPAASFLESRSWRGLEQQLGQTPVTKAVPGRRGIAIAYEDEASG
uniref:Uncharacterized protein n=1 Tax=Gopherus agassizii TaxID=38772 RepID=A0A452GWE0_9SAUR